MRLSQRWFVIGVMILLCSWASGHSLRKRRQDFVFPDEFNELVNRGGSQHPHQDHHPHEHHQPPPGELFKQPFRVPFPPILPGPPAFIESPKQTSTVMPDAMLTTPSPSLLACVRNCPTTSEYNPICGTNRELYFNQQKFDCALRCGAKVQIWRRGSCEGLFPMMRG